MFVQRVALKLMLGRSPLINYPRSLLMIKLRPAWQLQYRPTKRPHGARTLAAPRRTGVGEIAFPQHADSHLFGVIGKIQSPGKADSDASFPDALVISTQHHRFVGRQQFDRFLDQTPRRASLPSIEQVGPNRFDLLVGFSF